MCATLNARRRLYKGIDAGKQFFRQCAATIIIQTSELVKMGNIDSLKDLAWLRLGLLFNLYFLY